MAYGKLAGKGGITLNTALFFEFEGEVFQLSAYFEYYVFTKNDKKYCIMTIKEAHRLINEYETELGWKDVVCL